MFNLATFPTAEMAVGGIVGLNGYGSGQPKASTSIIRLQLFCAAVTTTGTSRHRRTSATQGFDFHDATPVVS
jgi:hypothetical protein